MAAGKPGWGCRPYEGGRDVAHPRARAEASRDMVGGVMATALHFAVKERAKKDGIAVYKLREAMGLGNSTWTRMTMSKPIAQATALKIVKHLGTDVRTVLASWQQAQKK